jgi:hypothetical protein
VFCFVQPRPGEIDEVIQAHVGDREKTDYYSRWRFEVILAVDDPEVKVIPYFVFSCWFTFVSLIQRASRVLWSKKRVFRCFVWEIPRATKSGVVRVVIAPDSKQCVSE